jgi:hypothetical protein
MRHVLTKHAVKIRVLVANALPEIVGHASNLASATRILTTTVLITGGRRRALLVRSREEHYWYGEENCWQGWRGSTEGFEHLSGYTIVDNRWTHLQ